jgi:hypothetical protein
MRNRPERKIETLAIKNGGKDRLVFDEARRNETAEPFAWTQEKGLAQLSQLSEKSQ